jgi:uncharacterized protein
MRVIDMHLNPLVRPDLARVADAGPKDLAAACERFADEFPGASIERGVIVILNAGFLDALDARGMPDVVRSPAFVLGYAPDLRAPHAAEQVERAHGLGVRALKFHPYLQQIAAEDFPLAQALAKVAASLGMFVMVCCSYGTRALDRYSGVRLAASLSEHVACPIVMSHAGGAQVIDAMLVAADAPNLYLDTSFSLPYYLGSSVETDFAFAMRKLGMHRWVYGSDAPFVAMKDALDVTVDFLERHRFGSRDIDDILYVTAAGILEPARPGLNARREA